MDLESGLEAGFESGLQAGLSDIETRVNAKLQVLIPDIYKVLNAFQLTREDALNRHAFTTVKVNEIEKRVQSIEHKFLRHLEDWKTHEEVLIHLMAHLEAMEEPWQTSLFNFAKSNRSYIYGGVCLLGSLGIFLLNWGISDHSEL